MVNEDLIAKDAFENLEAILKGTLSGIMIRNVDEALEAVRSDPKVGNAAFKVYNAYIVLSLASTSVPSDEHKLPSSPYFSALVTYISSEALWSLYSLFVGNYLSASRTVRFLLELTVLLEYVENVVAKLGLRLTIEEAILSLYLLSERGRFQFSEIIGTLPWPKKLVGEVKRLYKELSSLTHPTSKHFTSIYPPETASAWIFYKPLFLRIADYYVKVMDLITYRSIADNILYSLSMLNILENRYHVDINELKKRGLKYTYECLLETKRKKEGYMKKPLNVVLGEIVSQILVGAPKLRNICEGISKEVKPIMLETLKKADDHYKKAIFSEVHEKLDRILARELNISEEDAKGITKYLILTISEIIS